MESYMRKQNWAVVLAAGSGTRLQGMTIREDGDMVPKQYCSLYGGPSLLGLALARAYMVVPRDRVLCVVAAEHEQWWRRELQDLPAENVIVQPMNRGTAVGTLLPLLVARFRDPSARLVFLPADHYFDDEHIIASGIRSAFQAFETYSQRVLLLGLEPDEPDVGLGYILLAADNHDQVQPVLKFIEKPTAYSAKALIGNGALWNSFVFAAEADALLTLFRKRIPHTLAAFESLPSNPISNADRLAAIYRDLAVVDLSRGLFEGSEDHLAVLRIPSCGWTDLGTPERVVRCLANSTNQSVATRPMYPGRRTHVDLASACNDAFLSHATR